MLFGEEIPGDKHKHGHVERAIGEHLSKKRHIGADMRIDNKHNAECGENHERLIVFSVGDVLPVSHGDTLTFYLIEWFPIASV